jgi:hypothetical protein
LQGPSFFVSLADPLPGSTAVLAWLSDGLAGAHLVHLPCGLLGEQCLRLGEFVGLCREASVLRLRRILADTGGSHRFRDGSGESLRAFQVYMYSVIPLPPRIMVYLFGQLPSRCASSGRFREGHRGALELRPRRVLEVLAGALLPHQACRPLAGKYHSLDAVVCRLRWCPPRSFALRSSRRAVSPSCGLPARRSFWLVRLC